MSGLQVTLRIENLSAVQEQLGKLTGRQAREAYAKALNDTGFYVRRQMQAEIRRRFDRVTPYIERSPRVVPATADRLQVAIEPTYMGGKGVDPQKVLQAQSFGGRRRDKRSEVALRRVGLLPAGYQVVIPREPFPGSADAYGNIKGSFMVRVISYFQAFGEQGYKSNMTERRKRNLRNQQGIGSIATKKVYKTTLGVRFFASMGRLRGGHLAPGIWAASGTHDVQLKPVLMFVRAGNYQPRLVMDDVAKAADAQTYLDRRVRFRIREAAGV